MTSVDPSASGSRPPIAWKRRAASVLLIAFAIWPALQYGLVERYGVSPWKLAAWGMYSVPGPMKSVTLGIEGADGSLRVIDPGTFTEAERRAHADYFEHFGALGDLADAGPLAAAFTDRLGPGEGLVAGLGSLSLDPASGRVALEMRSARIDPAGRITIVPPPAPAGGSTGSR